MGFIPKGLEKEMRKMFTTLVKEAGKYITIFGAPEKSGCPNCYQDNTGISVNTFNSSFVVPTVIFGVTYSPISFTRGRCPVCEGTGSLTYADSYKVKALVLWNPASVSGSKGELNTTPAGLEGSNVVRIKADRCYYERLRDCTKATIDGVECSLALPPTIRFVGKEDVLVTVYFIATEVGHNVRGG